MPGCEHLNLQTTHTPSPKTYDTHTCAAHKQDKEQLFNRSVGDLIQSNGRSAVYLMCVDNILKSAKFPNLLFSFKSREIIITYKRFTLMINAEL